MANYYETLGVGKSATDDEIKKAYRALARKYHPDVNKEKDAEKKFKDISEAYAVLSDAEKKKNYDAVGHDRFTSSGQGYDFSQEDLRNFNFGGMGMDDIFGDIFGGGRSRRSTRPMKGEDTQYRLNVSFANMIQGYEYELNLNVNGSSEHIKVKIPAGVDNNSKIRIVGKGSAGRNGGPSGDMYIIPNIPKHPIYEREDANLILNLEMSVFEMMLGTKVAVPTPYGAVNLSIPAGTQSGQRFRLKERGVPKLKGDGRGDLYVVANVVIPKIVNDGDISLLQGISKNYPQPDRDKLLAQGII